MNGFIIYYVPFDNLSRVQLNHTLFGRIMYRNNRGNKYVFYIQGILDEIPFVRIADRTIFVLDLNGINLEELRIFGEISITQCDKDLSEDLFITAKEYWTEKAHKQGLPVKHKRIAKWKKELMY